MVRYLVCGALIAVSAPLRAEPLDQWRQHIDEAAALTGVPAPWIEQVMRAESGGRSHLNGRPITSSKGAMGLMQLIPATWSEMRVRHHLGRDPHDPRDNILAGAFYLQLLHQRFGYPGLFAAYNAGPTRYARHLATGRQLPLETRNYLARVAGRTSGGPGTRVPEAALFFTLNRAAEPLAPPDDARRGAGLFVLLRER